MRSSLCFTGNSQLSSHRHGDFQICSGPGGSNRGASPNCVSPRRTCDQFSPAPCVAVARSIFIIQFRSHFGLFFLLGNFIAFKSYWHQGHQNLLAPRALKLIGTRGTKSYLHQGHLEAFSCFVLIGLLVLQVLRPCGARNPYGDLAWMMSPG